MKKRKTRGTVLIIEDSPSEAYLLSELFKEEGWDVKRASSIRMMKRLDCTFFFMIVLDYHLPGVSGLDAIKVVRETFPKTAILVYTGNSDPSLSIPSLNAGADEWFVKGQHNGDLLEIMRAGYLRRRHREKCKTCPTCEISHNECFSEETEKIIRAG